MNSPRRDWNDEQWGEWADGVDSKLTELEKRQTRMQRTLRNRPTKWQVRKLIQARGGSASNATVWAAAITAAGVVAAAVIAGYIQTRTSVPIPIPSK
jgi:hypothetical protein